MTTFSIPITNSDQSLVDELTRVSGLSKKQIKHAMTCGAVWHLRKAKSKRIRRQNISLLPGDSIEFHFNEDILGAQPLTPILQHHEPDFSIWYKPAGMPMTGSRFGDHICLIRNIERQANLGKAYLVHRIDRYTRGLVVVGHNRSAAAELSRQFRERLVTKEYSAICWGAIKQSVSIFDEIDGKSAASHISPVQSIELCSEINIKIDTGRKHQIRRHLAGIGHAVLGDRRYGNEPDLKSGSQGNFDLQLCAWRLTILQPESQQPVCVELDLALRLDWDTVINHLQT